MLSDILKRFIYVLPVDGPKQIPHYFNHISSFAPLGQQRISQPVIFQMEPPVARVSQLKRPFIFSPAVVPSFYFVLIIFDYFPFFYKTNTLRVFGFLGSDVYAIYGGSLPLYLNFGGGFYLLKTDTIGFRLQYVTLVGGGGTVLGSKSAGPSFIGWLGLLFSYKL